MPQTREGSKYKIDRRRTSRRYPKQESEDEHQASEEEEETPDVNDGGDEDYDEDSENESSDESDGNENVYVTPSRKSSRLLTPNRRSTRSTLISATKTKPEKATPRRRSARESRISRNPLDGDILTKLPSLGTSAAKAKRKLAETTKQKDDDVDKSGSDMPSDSDSGNKAPSDDDEEESYQDSGDNDDDSDYDEEEEKKVDELLHDRRTGRTRRNVPTPKKKPKPKKAVHSSDEEFIVDSDEDVDYDSSQDNSLAEDDHYSDAEVLEVDDDIEMIGDPDLSDDDDVLPSRQRKGSIHKTIDVDQEQFGTIDDDSSEDDKPNQRRQPSVTKSEILPSPRGYRHPLDSESDQDSSASNPGIPSNKKSRGQWVRCPVCPSTEDAITAEPLPRLHVCYISPDGTTRQCFNLETLRQIALKSSQLQLRVDIDGERQNFLQPPAFRTPMSDDLVDQIASKFGRGALDLHGPYYTHRQKQRNHLNNANDDDEFHYDSYSSDDENIYNSLDAFRDRVKDYFRNGMGSQDVYVCPLCYGHAHRTILNRDTSTTKDSDSESDEDNEKKEVNAVPSDSIYDPIMVLGDLDNEEMSIASQFCFKKLADVKKHLREEHNVDTRGLHGNELYKRFLIRAPDGLLQRWLSTQVRGHVMQGHMRMYWNQGNDQLFIQLLDFMEKVRSYFESGAKNYGELEEEDKTEFDVYAGKAREFYDSFANKAFSHWTTLSSPFLKSNDNMKDFIKDDDVEDEEDNGDGQPHAFSHRQLMNSMHEDSDDNDLVHKLQRKYAETNDYDDPAIDCNDSTDEELELVDSEKEKTMNGYYSPIEEEDDEWMMQHQRKRKRTPQSTAKSMDNNNSKSAKTPIGKRIIRRKSTTPSAKPISARSTPSSSAKKRALTLQDSSSDED